MYRPIALWQRAQLAALLTIMLHAARQFPPSLNPTGATSTSGSTSSSPSSSKAPPASARLRATCCHSGAAPPSKPLPRALAPSCAPRTVPSRASRPPCSPPS